VYRTVFLVALLACPASVRAESFQIEDVGSTASFALSTLKPKTIAFSDKPPAEAIDGQAALVRFEDWARISPLQKRLLSLYESYVEPIINVTVHGVTKPYKERLHLYVARASFLLDKPAASIDLGRYATLAFVESIDPAIKHELITAADVMPLKDPQSAHNQHVERRWCTVAQSICMKSRYQMEGKFPIAIKLINKVDEGSKVADFFEFQSELRVLRPTEVDHAALTELTGVKAPVAGVLEQSIFYVNQMMQFGKLLAVLQNHPADPNKTVASVFLVLAIETDVLELKKKYETYPVLRNLVPAQVLLGKSSFNTGSSLSAGLPLYARNRLKAIADVLSQTGS
jgi:hypothetical protein